eukprot:TRINITY_DN37569_c0_g1_i3.p1 TRINITY_DN37569_c0_g1~~TRINITY_DN37569_c0_g1_i3.p1  ORF type:complete len:106 (+),score=22.49 TRINITY_DN37569_c0_g1_i3:565-882(+)
MLRAKGNAAMAQCGQSVLPSCRAAQEDLEHVARIAPETPGLSDVTTLVASMLQAREEEDSALYLSVAVAAQNMRGERKEAAAGEGSHLVNASKTKKKGKGKNKRR